MHQTYTYAYKSFVHDKLNSHRYEQKKIDSLSEKHLKKLNPGIKIINKLKIKS